MSLRRMRVLLVLLVGVLTAALSLVPLFMWRAARSAQITESLRTDARDLMSDLLRIVVKGADQQAADFPGWSVDGNPGGGQTAFSKSPIEGIPVQKWMSEAGDNESYRTVRLDNDEDYLGYIRPIADHRGYVVVVSTRPRTDALAALRRRALAIGAFLLAASFGLAWWVVRVALTPARRALADQQGFLADAAHEMRTPLAVILASSSQALSRPREPEEYVRSMSEIRSAAERASAGVNELLDLVRFDSGQALRRVAPLRLDLLAEEVAASVRPDEGTVVAGISAPVVVDADMALLRQAVDNLVRNAVRRAPHVELRTEVDGRDGVLEILDDGPGFDPAVLERVFDRYARGDRRGEVGLGMAIVKSIVAAHGGTVEASNRATGGASVRIRVPLSRRLPGT